MTKKTCWSHLKMLFLTKLIAIWLLWVVIVVYGKADPPNSVLKEEQTELQIKALARLAERINKVKDQLEELGKANLTRGPILSPRMADAELQRLEKVLQINTQFRQLTKERHSRTLRRHSQLEEKRDDNDEPELEAEEEKEGEEEAEDYVKDHAGSTSLVEDPKEVVKQETNIIMKIADDAASIATGIEDYTGYDAQEERKRAKAESDLALASGFGPIVGSYVSGESPDEVKAEEKHAETEQKKSEDHSTTKEKQGTSEVQEKKEK